MHRNSNQNDEPHHLYEIWDEQESEVFKYGISSDPIESDGLSKRTREQVQVSPTACQNALGSRYRT